MSKTTTGFMRARVPTCACACVCACVCVCVCVLRVARCVLCVVCCLLCVACCVLCVVCYVWCVVCFVFGCVCVCIWGLQRSQKRSAVLQRMFVDGYVVTVNVVVVRAACSRLLPIDASLTS